MEPVNPDPASPSGLAQPKPRRKSSNVPIPIVVGVICLGLGIAGGLVLAEFVNDHSRQAAGAGGEDGAKDEVSNPGGPGGKKAAREERVDSAVRVGPRAALAAAPIPSFSWHSL